MGNTNYLNPNWHALFQGICLQSILLEIFDACRRETKWVINAGLGMGRPARMDHDPEELKVVLGVCAIACSVVKRGD